MRPYKATEAPIRVLSKPENSFFLLTYRNRNERIDLPVAIDRHTGCTRMATCCPWQCASRLIFAWFWCIAAKIMYADARISPARINWRQGSGYKKHTDGYTVTFRDENTDWSFNWDGFAMHFGWKRVRWCSDCNARPRVVPCHGRGDISVERCTWKSCMPVVDCSVRVLSEPHRVVA